jgi:hypothetical protein
MLAARSGSRGSQCVQVYSPPSFGKVFEVA